MFKRLIGRIGKISVSAKKATAITLCSAFIVSTCCSFAYATPNIVTINDSESAPIQVTTNSMSVGKLLAKQGIVLNEGDKMNVALDDQISYDTVIEIYRSMPVNVNYMGATNQYYTTKKLVSDVLTEIGIPFDDDDSISPAPSEAVEENDTINVSINDTQIVKVQEELAYSTVERENTGLAPGSRVVVQAGQRGVKEVSYSIHYQNGIEVSRDVVDELVLAQPVEEIIEYNKQEEFKIGLIPASKPTNYTRMEVFEATAYDASPADNGQWAGKTSTGMPLIYGVVAVDPRVIPYGTRMYIESSDGQYVYGYAIAGDCGGAIKNKKVDLFFESRSMCYQFGRRNVNIYFLD